MRQAWSQMRSTSPNRRFPSAEAPLVDLGRSSKNRIHNLLSAVCRAAELERTVAAS